MSYWPKAARLAIANSWGAKRTQEIMEWIIHHEHKKYEVERWLRDEADARLRHIETGQIIYRWREWYEYLVNVFNRWDEYQGEKPRELDSQDIPKKKVQQRGSESAKARTKILTI